MALPPKSDDDTPSSARAESDAGKKKSRLTRIRPRKPKAEKAEKPEKPAKGEKVAPAAEVAVAQREIRFEAPPSPREEVTAR